MKRLLILAALLPFAALAQPLNTMNNPNQPGYVIPSQQRMQTEMMGQQQQQKKNKRDAQPAVENANPTPAAEPAKSNECQYSTHSAGSGT